MKRQLLAVLNASRFKRAYRNSLAKKIGEATHLSIKESKLEQLAVISAVCRGNLSKAAKITGKLDLNENELAILMGIDKKDKKISLIINESQQYRQERDVVTLDYRAIEIEDKEEKEPTKITPKNDSKQKSLFEF